MSKEQEAKKSLTFAPNEILLGLHLCLSVFLSVHFLPGACFVHSCLSLFRFDCLSVFQSINLWLCLCFHFLPGVCFIHPYLSLSRSLSLFVCLSVCLFFSPSNIYGSVFAWCLFCPSLSFSF